MAFGTTYLESSQAATGNPNQASWIGLQASDSIEAGSFILDVLHKKTPKQLGTFLIIRNCNKNFQLVIMHYRFKD